MAGAQTYEPEAPMTRDEFHVWPEEQRIVRLSRATNDQIATQIFMSGEISVDPPGILVTVEAFYID
jgi:hypothetical protein